MMYRLHGTCIMHLLCMTYCGLLLQLGACAALQSMQQDPAMGLTDITVGTATLESTLVNMGTQLATTHLVNPDMHSAKGQIEAAAKRGARRAEALAASSNIAMHQVAQITSQIGTDYRCLNIYVRLKKASSSQRSRSRPPRVLRFEAGSIDV